MHQTTWLPPLLSAAVGPSSSVRLRRARRAVGKATALGALALVAGACTTAPRAPAAPATRVLGEQSASASVVGQPAPAGTGELGAISCPDVLHCWTVGIAGPNATATTSPAAVTVIAATSDGGATWKAQTDPLPAPPELSGISCPTVTACMAVGSTGGVPGAGVVLTTRNGGTTWTAASVPTGSFGLTAVLCVTAAACTAVTSDGTNTWSAQSQNFGQSWVQEGNLPPGFSNPRALWCGAGGTCLIAGYTPTSTGHGQGAIALSQDSGKSWAAATMPTGAGVLQGATCPAAGACVAVGTTSTTVSDVVPATGQLLASADGGHTWTLSPLTPPVDDIFGIDCPTAKVCAVVGTEWSGTPALGTGAVARSEDGGATYTALRTAYVPLTLTAVACPGPTQCLAVGGDSTARITLPAPPVTPSSSVTPVRRPPLR
jgi:photosystem II stability/assembly factor-like uncharacterized protein